MKQVTVVMVVLLATIMSPLAATADERVGTVGSIQSAGAVHKASHPKYKKCRIEIDAQQMNFEGNSGWWLRENIAAMLRERLSNTGLVDIAVSGQAFDDVAASQDRIHDSGRYGRTSRREIPRGQMVAPTIHFVITGVANISSKNRGGNFSIGGRQIGASDTKAKATVWLTIEAVGLSSGLSRRSITVSGEASKSTNRNVSGWGRSFASANSDSSNIEPELLKKAAEQAVNKFVEEFVD